MSKMSKKCPTPFFWAEHHESFGFLFYFQPKKSFRVPTPWGLYGAEWDFFWYVGGFGDLGDPVVPNARGVSGDVVIVHAY